MERPSLRLVGGRVAESDNGLYVVPDTPEVEPFRRQGLGYVFQPPGARVRFRVDAITRGSDGLRGRIAVDNMLPGLPGHMYRGRHLLEGSRSLADLRKALEEIAGPEHGIPWGAFIRTLTASVVDAEEAGAPFETVGQLAQTTRPTDLVQYLVTRGKTSTLYGPGGYGKGYIATGIGVAVTLGEAFAGLACGKGPVLYCDWEDDRDTLDDRVKKICAGRGIPPVTLHYRRCERPLPEEVEIISQFVDTHGVVLLIVDSVEMASISGEHQNYNDRATAMQRALRLIHCSHLLIDHVSDAGRRGPDLAGKAIGGIMKGNLARNQWEIKREQDVGATLSHVGLYQTKTNHTMLLPPIGLELDFRQPDAVRITRKDVRESPQLAAPLTAAYRIQGELRHGPMSIPDLAEALPDLKTDTIEKAVHRGKDKWCYEVSPAVSAKGQPARWGLLSRDRATG